MENFPKETKMIVDSGAEISCHGYVHEGGSQMTETQERAVIKKCVELATKPTDKETTLLTGSSIPTLRAYSENA